MSGAQINNKKEDKKDKEKSDDDNFTCTSTGHVTSTSGHTSKDAFKTSESRLVPLSSTELHDNTDKIADAMI